MRLRPPVLLVLLLAAPLAGSAQGRPPEGERLMLPESTLKLLLRNRQALGLTGDQVMTIELKASELELRTRERLADFQRAGGRGGGPGGPRMGVQAGAGGMGVSMGTGADGGGGPPGAASEERTRQLMAELEKLDRASVEAVRPVLTPAQTAKVDAMLAARAQWMAEHPPPRPARPPEEGAKPPAPPGAPAR